MSIKGFDDWLATSQGQYVLAWERSKYESLVADIFGFNALQLGLSQHDFLAANRMPFKFRCDDRQAAGSAVRASAWALPFASGSVDLVLMPHVLEFDLQPHRILREVERVLVPEGQVILSGFNPYSLWGVRRKFARKNAAPPWRGQYLSVQRLKDWFALLSFETQAGAFGCYAPPVATELQRWRLLELAGNRWWPIAGAAYILRAIKRVHGMRLITPVWHRSGARAKALAPVAQRNE